VPGASVPLYVCGALMKTYFPVSIPTHGVGLNITVQSYNGSLDYGLIACRRAVPDIADLADYLVEEHRKLHGIAMALPSESPTVEVEKGPAAKPVRKAAVKATTKRAKAASKPIAKPVAKAARKAVRKPRAPAATVH
jgi:diacylglycerol O-acyltransferase